MSMAANGEGGILGDSRPFDTSWVDEGDIRMSSSEPVSDLTSMPDVGVPSDGSDVVRQINSLLRGEISAAETYRNVLDKMAAGDNAENTGLLRSIQAEHGRACQSLRDRIRELGGEAADSSGPWGVWAQVVQGSMSLFGGDVGGLKALKEGEEHGLKDYSDALTNVDPASAQLIQNQMIPAQERHIGVIEQLVSSGLRH